MEQYLEEKKASQKRPAAPFQRQERKKATFQSPQRPVASGSGQVSSQRSPSGKKECPHCGRAHGGTECWLVARKCLKCGSSDHKIKDCPRLQQGAQRGPAPIAAAAAPATGRPGRPRAPARVLWLRVVGVVFLLVMASRGEMGLGVRIRVSSRPQHPRVLYFLHRHQ
ncbi:hypothetical protein Taro_017556 [Colocasia esculenta]|uniref:CCHC-type domain-containing protein n=1 Tax=Colocasia esculenta TaxID=4460 RepID=A0A843UNY4_COLES|nr:hypothetical protein [Colocasia esculenta]